MLISKLISQCQLTLAIYLLLSAHLQINKYDCFMQLDKRLLYAWLLQLTLIHLYIHLAVL